MMRNLTAACALLAALVVGGCESGSEPSGPAGRYTLYHAAGAPPPATFGPSDLNYGSYRKLLGSRLILNESGAASITLEIRHEATSGGTVTMEHDTIPGQWRAEGSRLHLTFAQGEGYFASAALVSPREVAVSLHQYRAASTGFYTITYPLLYRR